MYSSCSTLGSPIGFDASSLLLETDLREPSGLAAVLYRFDDEDTECLVLVCRLGRLNHSTAAATDGLFSADWPTTWHNDCD